MPKLVAAVKLISVLIGSIKVTASFKLIATVALVGFSLLNKPGRPRRDALAATLQTGEVARQGVFGRAAVAGSLVDAFNFGGKYGTDWEVLVIALADHRCDALEGFFVDDAFHTFTGDGAVPGFNGQLEVYFRDGRWDQEVPSILTTHGPGWTPNDRGRGVAWAVVAYKADDEKAKTPIWEGRRPSFQFVLRGLRAYQARKDSSIGGSGAHRWDNPATREWTENPIDIRHTWVRGIYAGDRVNQPEMLLLGRGLSPIEAPPQNVFARANLCDELVDGEPRYRIGGVVSADEPYIETESDFAASCGGVISQPEGAVEVDPGEARAPVAHFTDRDLIVGSRVSWSEFLGIGDEGWVNTVIARFVDPAQRWRTRGAPVRRETADIIADGGPREQTLTLTLVTYLRQSERLAEIARRLGRLWARGTVTLPPRFAGIEEGDWVTWQSDRYLKGATRTFRVEAWGSDQGWRHQLTLRQISASVFSDTAPLDDGVIAAQQPAPPALQPPIAGAWALSATTIAAGGVRVPALQIVGQTDDPAAGAVVFEFIQQATQPDANTPWTLAGTSRPDVTRLSIPVPSGGTHYVAVSYVIDGVTGPRRVLGPVTLAQFAYPNGVSIADLQPAEFGANVTENRTAAFIGNQGALATLSAVDLSGVNVSGTLPPSRADAGLVNANLLPAIGEAAASADWVMVEGRPFALRDEGFDASGRIFANGLIYGNFQTVEGVRPAEFGANVTENRVAAFISGQAPAATDFTIQTGATNDQGADTRFDNFDPLHYRQSWLRRLRTEFKFNPAVMAPAEASGVFGTLETYSAWSESSGGSVWQRLTDSAGARFIRHSVGVTPTETWGPWQPEYSGNRRPFFGADLLEEPGGPVATLGNFKTNIGTAAFLAGEGALARQNSASWTSQISGRPNALTDLANAGGDQRLQSHYIYDVLGGSNSLLHNRWPAEFGANVTEGRTAAFVSGQGALATQNTAAWSQVISRPFALQDSGIDISGRLIGDRLAYLDGATVQSLRPAEVNANVTEGRVAAFVSGQGALATQNTAGWSQVVSRPFALQDAGFNVSGLLLGERLAYLDGTTVQALRPAEVNANVTENRVAAFISGQAPAATDFTVQAGATNDRGADTRFDNYDPQHYRANWERRLRTEFKWLASVGAPADASGLFGTLETYSAWSDNSGGPVWQRLTDSAGARFIRHSLGITPTETWGPWQPEYSGNRRPFFGADLLEEPGGPVATLGNFKTNIGTSAFVAGQSPWVTTGIPLARVGLLNDAGRANSRRITSQIVAGGVLQTLNTNPLTASTDSGTGVSTITINAHSVFDDFGQLDFSASSIGGLNENTLYYVWEANPDFVGGARSYVATTDRNALTVAGRRYVGFVTTPATGSGPNDGGGGGGAGFPGAQPELLP